MEGDIAAQMVEGIRHFLLRETEASISRRQSLWRRDYSSREAYETSVAPNRESFRKIIGLIDDRVPYEAPEIETIVGGPLRVAGGSGYNVHSVRWPAMPGVDAEGLLLEPTVVPVARVVALPDADWSPEMLVGLTPGVVPEAQFGRRLAENGCLVLIPTLIDRQNIWSGNPTIPLLTNEPHREFIYRMAFEVGRLIIGYEVQKVLAALDWFKRSRPALPIGVVGYGEGGLLALYSAAADTRIEAAAISGYFQSRQELWTEPIYRNVWGLLQEFGDAELASLIAPRALVVEASHGPEIAGPPPATEQVRNTAAPGRLRTPSLVDVQAEIERAGLFFKRLGVPEQITLVVSGSGEGNPGSEPMLRAFLHALGIGRRLKSLGAILRDERTKFDPLTKRHRQFDQLVAFTQDVVRRSEDVRQKFWSKADSSSVEAWQQSTEPYKRYFWEEIIGRLPDPSNQGPVRTRKIYDEPNWTGYEVVLPVWPDVFTSGILLLPKNLESGERRPVVVCQHGLEGRPQDLIKPTNSVSVEIYHRQAATLAEHGFVIYCPQNPYIGRDNFRSLQRIANPIKRSLFSVILGQHQRTLDWLTEQPFVDPKRIAFYGLSYGGKTAVRVPPLLDKYALSICSGDFNEWIWKVSSNGSFPGLYVYTSEYEIPEFNIGNRFNHAELANLMAPRPFMVERGHSDGVSLDERVAYEYAKVRRLYDHLGISERTRIEYFDGPHTIHGVGTFQFLYHFLNWSDH